MMKHEGENDKDHLKSSKLRGKLDRMEGLSHLETTSQLRAIFDHAIDGIITIDSTGLIEMVNPAASKLFGYVPEELIGENISILMPNPDRRNHDQYIHNYHQTGIGRIIGIGREVTGLRKDGTRFPFHLSVSEVNLSSGKIFTGIIHDISDLKLAQEKLRRYAAELERSNIELQDFAYVSSHDLQEPLRKIQAFGDRLMMKEGENLSEQGKDYLERMLSASARMQKLINDLLAFSRVSKQMEFVSVNLNTIIQEVLTDLEILIEKNNATILVDELPTIEAQPTQMRQLFQNLISNAIKFRKPDEAPRIHISSEVKQIKAHLSATPGDEILEISVEDNGIGFDVKYLDRIFNIFQRLEGRKYEGSGIGLAVCRKIATHHGGTITAHSQIGKGSTFVVTLSIKHAIKYGDTIL
ncbi:PAS domain S-box protein [Cytophagaceae bacterium YF14B1]|uniref:Sensor protein FixL n=1 Tax=Xanthocytophaga flava TaxID=3048013 RepID=A0AAE3UA85_9BACT|nr:PAS domain S-box protein [Xanthocytophaga flavus]MDJ1485266.1 PAS domain S-box protein [Xanthocytophaga flavus]